MRFVNYFIFMIILFSLIGCGGATHKLHEEGRPFTFNSDNKIIIDQTTKKQIIDIFGQPTSSDMKGKYQILKYNHEQQTFKTAGYNPLGLVPIVGAVVSIAELSTDQDTEKDIIREWEKMVIYIDMTSGIVKDYYYNDSKLRGHDESESLRLTAGRLRQNGKNEKSLEILEKAISSNPNNHRALNDMAWILIDLDIDIDKGVKYAEMAVKVFPDSPYNNGTLGIGYFKKGTFDQAEKYLQKAVELFPVYAPENHKALEHDKAFLEKIKQQKS